MTNLYWFLIVFPTVFFFAFCAVNLFLIIKLLNEATLPKMPEAQPYKGNCDDVNDMVHHVMFKDTRCQCSNCKLSCDPQSGYAPCSKQRKVKATTGAAAMMPDVNPPRGE